MLEVGSSWIGQIEAGEINASISVDGNVTFADSTPQFTKADGDAALARAQGQAKLLRDVERALNSSKDSLQKVRVFHGRFSSHHAEPSPSRL